MSFKNSNYKKEGSEKILDEFQRPNTPIIVIEDFEEQLSPSSSHSSIRNSEFECESDIIYNYGFGQTNHHFLRVPSKTSSTKNISQYEVSDCINTFEIIQKINL